MTTKNRLSRPSTYTGNANLVNDIDYRKMTVPITKKIKGTLRDTIYLGINIRSSRQIEDEIYIYVRNAIRRI